MASQTTGYINTVQIDDGSVQNIGSTAYGVCETAAATAAKVVDMTGFVLTNGATIHVRMTNSNTVANPTLNVNSTGAKKIYRYGTTAPSTSAASSWYAGTVVSFTYDSSLNSNAGAWVMNNWLNTDTNTNTMVSQSSTTTANWRKIVLGYQNDSTAGTAVTAATNVVYVDPDFEYQASTGVVRIKSTDAGAIKLYRNNSAGGAFIDYFNNNQSTNYWRTGMQSDNTFGFIWKGSISVAVAVSSTGNVSATTFNSYTLADACAKGVDTSIAAGSTSTNLPTSKAVNDFAVANQSDWCEDDTASPAYINNRTHYGQISTDVLICDFSGSVQFRVVNYCSNSFGNSNYIAVGAKYKAILNGTEYTGVAAHDSSFCTSYGPTNATSIAFDGFKLGTCGSGSSTTPLYAVATSSAFAETYITTLKLYEIKENGVYTIVNSSDCSFQSGASSITYSSVSPGWNVPISYAIDIDVNKKYNITVGNTTLTNVTPTNPVVWGTYTYSYPGITDGSTFFIFSLGGHLVGGASTAGTYAMNIECITDVETVIVEKHLDTTYIDGWDNMFPSTAIGSAVKPIYWNGTSMTPANPVFGTCSTGASSQTKSVTAADFSLVYGATIHVYFTYTNTATSPKLNVNYTGAKSIYLNSYTAAGKTTDTSWEAGSVVALTYDGSKWLINDYREISSSASNLSLGNAYGTCSTAAATVAKTVSLSGFVLNTHGRIAVKFTYEVPASATLNVNSTGAKAIYYRGSALTAGMILAGDTAEFIYDGSNWILTSVDRENIFIKDFREPGDEAISYTMSVGKVMFIELWNDCSAVLVAPHMSKYSEHYKGYLSFCSYPTSVTFPTGTNIFGDTSELTISGTAIYPTDQSSHIYMFEYDNVETGSSTSSNEGFCRLTKVN